MAGMTKAQAEVAGHVDAARERIITLIKGGASADSEGVKSVEQEAEALISGVTGAGSVGIKSTLRAQVREALATKSAEVAQVEPDWLRGALAAGSKKVRKLAETNVKGGEEIARLQLQIRSSILNPETGLPDLKAELQISKDAAKSLFEDAAEGLDESSELAVGIKRIKRQSQNKMVDLRVSYALSLNQAPEAPAKDADDDTLAKYDADLANWQAEVAKYDSIEREPGETTADAIARHYSFPLMTRSAQVMAAKAAKELEAATGGDEEGDGEGSGSAGGSDTGEEKSPAKVVTESIDLLGREVARLLAADIDEAFAEYDAEARKEAIGFLETAVESFKHLLTVAKAAAYIEAEQDAEDEAEAKAAEVAA